MYLCYDLKGIQNFIFQVPRLKYIVGGSALVDRFDRVAVRKLAEQRGWDLVSAGGGKGVLRVRDSEQALSIERTLIGKARDIGADIRFGLDDDFTEASQAANRLYPYLPDPTDLDGHPCRESGLYPTKGGHRHRVVEQRDWSGGERIGRHFEKRLEGALQLEQLQDPVFLRNFDDATEDGLPGHRALGGRNRWAIICMDGNDMGMQFRMQTEALRKGRIDEQEFVRWLKRMSSELDSCSEAACAAGIRRVLEEWAREPQVRRQLRGGKLRDKDKHTVVPFRPVVVGGDDITVLCHASYAASFVLEACKTFADQSEVRAAQARKDGLDLWPGTKGALTISAGVLYCGTTMPLASAIPYAETLLANAKSKGRKLSKRQAEADPSEWKPSEPAPACIDFEAVTETLLDHPEARRRELIFLDGDLDDIRVELTRRPYTLTEFEKLSHELRRPDVLQGVPNTILHQLLPGLRQSASGRQVFRARLGKHQHALFDALAEDKEGGGSRWRRTNEKDAETRVGRPVLSTDLIDLAILAEEGRRMEWNDE